MPTRKDFAIVRSEAMSNDHICDLADDLVDAELATEDVSLQAAIGIVAQLGLWCYRETDDGHMTRRNVRHALSSAGRLLDVVWMSSMFRDVEDGVRRLRGFEDCYGSYVERRKRDAERKRVDRRRRPKKKSASVQRTSAGRPGAHNKTGQDMTPDMSCPGGAGHPAPDALPAEGREGSGASGAGAGRDGAASTWRKRFGDDESGTLEALLLLHERRGPIERAGIIEPQTADMNRRSVVMHRSFGEAALAKELERVGRWLDRIGEKAPGWWQDKGAA